METIEETAHLNRVRHVISLIHARLATLDLTASSNAHAQATIMAVAKAVNPYGDELATIAAGRVIDSLMWL